MLLELVVCPVCLYYCTARQCSPLKFMDCSINNPALSLFMKRLVIGRRQKAPNFSAFHWPPHGSLVSIGQHFVDTRVVHLPKQDRNKLNYQIGPKRTKLPVIATMYGLHSLVRFGPGCAGRA